MELLNVGVFYILLPMIYLTVKKIILTYQMIKCEWYRGLVVFTVALHRWVAGLNLTSVLCLWSLHVLSVFGPQGSLVTLVFFHSPKQFNVG